MSIGAGIFLLAVGAILSFGVRDNISGVDLTTIGYILMGAGVLGLILGIALNSRRRGSSTTARSAVDPTTGEKVVHTEHTSDI